ncbi:MAG: FHA domain-containing protein [Lentisphaeria bacterium]|nr:FHA domain-containing protein [Lentisphaeria bacterium]
MKIRFINGADTTEELEFSVPEITIGAVSDNLLILEAESISSHHGILCRTPEGDWIVRDLNSTNGITVNGTPVRGETGLAEGDVLLFGTVEMQISDLAPEPVRPVIFSSVPAEETPEETPPPPPAATEKPEREPVAPPEKEYQLFDDPESPETVPENKGKRLFSNRVYYALLLCVVVVGAITFHHLSNAPAKPAAKAHDPVAAAKKFLLYYEKSITAPDNAFRIELRIENGKGLFLIDDLKSKRHFRREIPAVNPASVDLLRLAAKRVDFPQITAPAKGSKSVSEGEFRRLLIADTDLPMHDVRVINTQPPKAFEDLEHAIGVFAENYGLQTFSLTPEELLAQAENNFLKAEDLFENREARLSNLRSAVQRYQIAVDYLEQFAPRPPIWEKARTRLAEAKQLRDAKLLDLKKERIRLARLKEYDQVRYILNQTMELADPDSPEYDFARKKIFEIDSFLNRGRRKK